MTPRNSFTEENYLKHIYKLAQTESPVSSSDLAEALRTTPASVTDMVKKLYEKKLINYSPYHGVSLTPEGERQALRIWRRNRLWEVFLQQKLNYAWDEVLPPAEQLEHIQSDTLYNRLAEYLNQPINDPHGEPIPQSDLGLPPSNNHQPLSSIGKACRFKVLSVSLDDPDYLRYLTRIGIALGTELMVKEPISYENSLLITVEGKDWIISQRVSAHLWGNVTANGTK
jgi:DtxR family Mn-dependent transcriptional regulator